GDPHDCRLPQQGPQRECDLRRTSRVARHQRGVDAARAGKLRTQGYGTPIARLSANLREAARRYGTPCFVTDAVALDEAAAELRSAFPDPWIRSYSLKANDVRSIVERLTSESGPGGLGANVVSRGE